MRARVRVRPSVPLGLQEAVRCSPLDFAMRLRGSGIAPTPPPLIRPRAFGMPPIRSVAPQPSAVVCRARLRSPQEVAETWRFGWFGFGFGFGLGLGLGLGGSGSGQPERPGAPWRRHPCGSRARARPRGGTLTMGTAKGRHSDRAARRWAVSGRWARRRSPHCPHCCGCPGRETACPPLRCWRASSSEVPRCSRRPALTARLRRPSHRRPRCRPRRRGARGRRLRAES